MLCKHSSKERIEISHCHQGKISAVVHSVPLEFRLFPSDGLLAPPPPLLNIDRNLISSYKESQLIFRGGGVFDGQWNARVTYV